MLTGVHALFPADRGEVGGAAQPDTPNALTLSNYAIAPVRPTDTQYRSSFGYIVRLSHP